MCGICGVIDIKRAEVAEDALIRMMALLRHRGPDDKGLLVEPPLAMGMRRLSIIDLAEGHQPIFNEDGNIAVVFNGEIYNFQDLRRTLESCGHVFHSRSDTEAIVHAYEEWGEDCVKHLRGMFAFAIYDRRTANACLFLARDRFGIKPLYYAFVNGVFLFASEVRALLATRLIPRRASPSALQSYLLFGSVAEPMTMVEDIYSLPPGHRMVISISEISEGRVELRPDSYWDLYQDQAAGRFPPSAFSDQHSALVQLRSLLEESVRLHLIADVPVGVFLSSGIDSTALTALASREKPDLHTFTVFFDEQEFSESKLARQTVKQFGTKHQEVLLSGDEMLSRLDQAISALDQPSMDGINTYFVSWAASQAGLKVALSGLGGDEVFGGYNTFRWTPRFHSMAEVGRRIPNSLRAVTAPIFSLASKSLISGDAERKLTSLWLNPDSFPHPYFFTRLLFTPEQTSALINGVQGSQGGQRWYRAHAMRPYMKTTTATPWWTWLTETAKAAEELDGFTAVSCLELRSYLANTLLRDTDSMSMAHSLEVRVPFLDHPLIEFVSQLPGSMKRHSKIPKVLLVQALKDLLPLEVVMQRKRTFTFPWQRWLQGPLREPVAVGISDIPPALQPLLSKETFQATWEAFLKGQTSWSRPWSLYVLNEWARRYLSA